MKFGWLSIRLPYACFILNSVKTLEMWWRPVLCEPGIVPWPSTLGTGTRRSQLGGSCWSRGWE